MVARMSKFGLSVDWGRTFGATTLSIMTFSRAIQNVMLIMMTVYAECYYTECSNTN